MIAPLEWWTTKIFMLLLMDKILHQLIWYISHYLSGGAGFLPSTICFSGLFLLSEGDSSLTSVSDLKNSSLPSKKRNTSDHVRTRWFMDVWCNNFMFSHVAKLLNSEDFWRGYMVMDPKKICRWVCILRSFASEKLGSTLGVHLIKRNHGWEKGIFRGWNPQLCGDYNKPIIRITIKQLNGK